MIYAVDFDGTLCEDKYPDIGRAKYKMIDFIKRERLRGAKIILWTCRCGERLSAAERWCGEHDITFDAVNENLPENIAQYGGDPRKVYADCYIDDRNMGAK